MLIIHMEKPLIDFDQLLPQIQNYKFTQEEYDIYRTLTFEQKIRFISLDEKAHFLIFMITVPLSDAYKIFFNMTYYQQEAFFKFGRMKTSLEFVRLTSEEKNLFLELPKEIHHQVASILHNAYLDRLCEDSFGRLVYAEVMTPKQIIYNFKMHGMNVAQYEIHYIQNHDSVKKYRINICSNCGYTVHYGSNYNQMYCGECHK